MDTEKFNMGWCLAIIHGTAPDNSKLRRFLLRDGFQKMTANTYARSSVRGQDGMAKIVDQVRAKGFIEVSISLVYVTRAQWERSYRFQGKPISD